MANPEHLKILKQGVDVWNRWREENPDCDPDLSEAKLSEADLSTANLCKTDLSKANLTHANLTNANLSNADLSDADLYANFSSADLTGADLHNADLAGADLYRANLSGADLSWADLSKADLSEANLNKARLGRAVFTRANLFGTNFQFVTLIDTLFIDNDLRDVENLEKVYHAGRSYIDISTIYKSYGDIPETFLRGCGVPDNFIEYIKSLSGAALEYHSCFISYSSKDEDFAKLLYEDLQNKGVRCWYAPEDMKIGDKIRDRLDKSIQTHDKLLLILSEHSINSEWVEDEVESGYEQEQKRKPTILFPIRLDDAIMDTEKAWAAKLRRSRHIGDFTNWKDHDSYQNAFERLLRDLKADADAREKPPEAKL
jgi:uncharacterized protein YjbI with pentapeptide repeats